MESFWKHLNIKSEKLSLIEAGMQHFILGQEIDYIVKQDFILHAVIDGEGYYQTNGNTYHLVANDGFILKQNTHVRYWPSEENPWTTLWVGIGGEDLYKHISETTMSMNDAFTYHKDSLVLKHLHELVNILNNEMLEKKDSDLYILSHLYLLIHEIKQEFALPSIKKTYAYLEVPELIKFIYDYIYETYTKGITVEQIANHFGINRNYLFKLCKEHFGQSPKQIIQELRMNKASQLLRSSNQLIKEVAAQVGYSDSLVFSNMFKSYYNYSPTVFRKLPEEQIDKALFIREKLTQ